MKVRLVLLCMYVGLGALRAVNAQETKPSLHLILSPDKITVTPENSQTLDVKWINNSHRMLWCNSEFSSAGIDESFAYDVRDSSGSPVSRLTGVKGAGAFGPVSSDCAVGSEGGTINSSIGCVMCAFDIRRPGVYTVQISRPDPDHPDRKISSNKVTITVVLKPVETPK